MQGVELVLVFGLLGTQPLGALQHGGKPLQLICMGLAMQLPNQAPQQGTLALERPAQALELLGVGIAACFESERRADTGVALSQGDAFSLGGLHQLVPGNLQQAAVGGVSDVLLLHRGVDDDLFQIGTTHRLQTLGSLDGLGQQFFDAGFSQPLTETRQ